MRLEPRIHLSQPHFELYECVTLFWHGRTYDTKIVQRWYNPDEECWLYRVYGSEQFFTVDAIEKREAAA
ncbi:MAG: hypothetical protein KME45_32770 [Stenomitos rutilans HA7619-LM2]|jgi:hypothetical protein|nr:hypothetical protein [Stenomitos rutilans HA7619-LM2]